ncbi:hypothetical protein CYY_004318 [Polysphondylium violaceum]|uniref:Uncharacterized protein n=1 Tax=Polysphondylium violaceum TaxID=133409 RepID=A0A8J4V7W2_9MYCE|nr:hypothetical protein CYY_004318 [Polysphondylium violaceum]
MEQYTRAELVSSRESLWAICGAAFQAYENCKLEKGDDPEACLKKSIAVTGCTQKIMKDIVALCNPELKESATCCEENNMRTLKCPNEEKALENCFENNVLPKYK